MKRASSEQTPKYAAGNEPRLLVCWWTWRRSWGWTEQLGICIDEREGRVRVQLSDDLARRADRRTAAVTAVFDAKRKHVLGTAAALARDEEVHAEVC